MLEYRIQEARVHIVYHNLIDIVKILSLSQSCRNFLTKRVSSNLLKLIHQLIFRVLTTAVSSK